MFAPYLYDGVVPVTDRIARGEKRAAVNAALATKTPAKASRLPYIRRFRIITTIDQASRVVELPRPGRV
jgi:hypothetical protein